MNQLSSKSSGYFLSITIIVITAVLVFINYSSNQASLPAYFVANQNYELGKFSDAIAGYYEALRNNPNLIKKEPLVRFKIGYGFYKTGEYQKSMDVFETSRSSLEIIEDYLLYFKFLSTLQKGDTSTRNLQMKEIRVRFPDSPVIPLLDSIQASYFMQKDVPDSAIHYLQVMLRSNYFDADQIYLNLLRLHQAQKDTLQFRRTGLLFLKKYPFHDYSETLFQNLVNSYDGKISYTSAKALFNYLFKTRQFLAAADFLEKQAPFASTSKEIEYYQWLPSELLYRRGEYQQVLEWSLNERKKFKIPTIRRNIDLNIARCYLRLGDIGNSIRYYLEFQRRYPRDFLSPEVLWKVAWLYEETGNLNKAIKTYEKLIKTYRRSEFSSEAKFRIGLGYYRQKKYAQARKVLEFALRTERSGSQRDRIKYWIGKCYEIEKDYKRQGEIFIELAERPVDSFYNLKAFFLTSNGQDIHQKVTEAFWELHQQNVSYLPNYIDHFRRTLLVEEILGASWGDREIRSLDNKQHEWEAIFALGELYERMENYGFAYRRFRTVFNQKFIQANLDEMIPVFKKLYPLYYSTEVDSFARQYSVPPELIWSVMKKESAFAPKVISYANAYGLMQLIPSTASQIAPRLDLQFTSTRQLFEPATNIRMGTYYLSTLLRKYDENYVMALAGYNAGPHRVDRWLRTYPTPDDDLFMENLEFEQTRVYVRTCLKYFWIYQTITRPGEIPKEIINYPVNLKLYL